MAKAVGEYIPEYKASSALDTLSVFEQEYSRVKLIEVLAKQLNYSEIKPGKTFASFVNLHFNEICTTNSDFLLETSLSENNIPHSTIVEEDRLTISLNDTTQLIKLHGDFIHPDKMIVTENDYDNYVNKNKLMCTKFLRIKLRH